MPPPDSQEPEPRRGLRLIRGGTSEDGRLLARAARGDQAAFRVLLERYLPRVVSTARRMLGTDGEAEDVGQEAMIRLWRKAGEIEVGEAGLGGWLYRVAANLALDRLRRRRNVGSDPLERETTPPEQLRQLGQQELARRVDQALQALPECQRLALVLCHYEGLSMAEAGEVIGVSAEAIESLLGRGRRALRASLATEWRMLLPEDGEASG